MTDSTSGLCACGCGQRTTVPTESSYKNGRVKGVPMKYVHGHNSYGMDRTKPGTRGYKQHKRDGQRVNEHILIAERALGKRLPTGAEVHHVNGNKRDNRPGNLVVCHDRAYHQLLHRRQEAKAACGNPSYRRCSKCKLWSPPEDLFFYRPGRSWYHHGRRCQKAQRAA